MAATKQKTKYTGVYFREHPTRKNGSIRKDRYFIIRYTLNGKQRDEGFGWESEGFTEQKAIAALNEIKENIKKGSGFFSLKEKAELAAAEKEREKAAEAEAQAKNITFAELWQNIYKPAYLDNKIAKTRQNETIAYTKYIEPTLGNMRLLDITPTAIEKIKTVMNKRAPATINHALAVIRQAFNAAKKAGIYAGDNPSSQVKRLKKDNRRIRFLTREEASVLFQRLGECKTQNLYDMSLLALNCGLRAGEIFSLQRIDIDFNNKKIAIRDPKGVFNRFANMTAAVYDMLNHRAANLAPQDYIFLSEKGEKINEISNQFQRIVDSLGFNDGVADRRNRVVFHTLRHTFASWLAMAGVDIYTIKELMGHSDIKMTQRYMHLAPNKFTSAIAVLDTPLITTQPQQSESSAD